MDEAEAPPARGIDVCRGETTAGSRANAPPPAAAAAAPAEYRSDSDDDDGVVLTVDSPSGQGLVSGAGHKSLFQYDI